MGLELVVIVQIFDIVLEMWETRIYKINIILKAIDLYNISWVKNAQLS